MSGLWEIDVPVLVDFQNECTNPSFEKDVTGWTSGGTNTLAQSSDRAWRGGYSAKVTVGNNATLASIAPTFLLTNTTYYLKCRIYVSSNWDGGNIDLDTSGFIGATETDVKIYTHGTSPTAEWLELKATLALSADAGGTITLTSASVATAGRIIYFDAVLFSPYDVTYFDGETPGAAWDGLRHKSTSTMDGQNRLCGVPTNLDDFATYVVGNVGGVNFLPQRHSAQAFARLPGAIYQYTNKNVRSITIPASLIGTSLSNLHSRRKGLFNVIKNMYHGQPFTLRYNGADATKQIEIDVRLDDAPTSRVGFTDDAGLRLISHTDPFFRGLGDNIATLTRETTIAVNYLLGFRSGAFTNLGGGGTGSVLTVALDQNRDVYIGGTFDNWEAVAAADRFAYYDVSAGTWNAIGSGGTNGNILKLLFTPDGTLYIGGAFTSIGGTAANRVATWNGAALAALGTGMSGTVNTIAYNPVDGKVYFGGVFATANGVTVNNITRWNGTTFEALDSGVNADVRTILIHPGTGNVYIGGDFTTMGSGASAALRVAMWNLETGAWENVSALTGGGFGSDVYALAFDSAFNIYAGADTTSVDGLTISYVAIWNGSTWQGVGPGLNQVPSFFLWQADKNKMFMSGTFTADGNGRAFDRVAVWNGSQFEDPAIAFGGQVTAYAEEGKNFYYVGAFSGTIHIPGITSVSNNGTDETYPLLVIENTGSSGQGGFQRLENLTTHKVILSDFSRIAPKDRLIVDLRPGQKRVLYEDILTGQQSNITGIAVLPGSNFATWSLVPGINKILLRVSDASGSPTINAYLLWRDRYEFIDGIADDV